MVKRFLAIVLVGLTAQATVFANTRAEKGAAHNEKIRAGISKLGVGRDSRVEVKLRDNSKLAGYISEAGDDRFVITSLDNGATTVVDYPDVAQVKGHNLSKGTKIAIGVGIAAAVLVIAFIKWASQFE